MFELILKSLGVNQLVGMFLPLALTKVGNYLKNKDADAVGADDVAGNIFISAGVAFQAFGEGNESAFKKALKTVRDTIDAYLKLPSSKGAAATNFVK